MNKHETNTLEAKIRRFAGELTPEERVHLRTVQPHDVTGMRSSPLWHKAQQVAGTLTSDEEAALRRMLERAGVTAAGSDAAEAQGFRMAAYEEHDGWKGKPGTNPNGVAKGGVPLSNLGAVLIIAAGIIWPSNVINNNGGQESPPPSTGPLW